MVLQRKHLGNSHLKDKIYKAGIVEKLSQGNPLDFESLTVRNWILPGCS